VSAAGDELEGVYGLSLIVVLVMLTVALMALS
jgi:hypothetical protein